MTNKTLFLLTIPMVLEACGPAPGTRAHDDSAVGHRQEAASHQADADKTLASAGSKAYYNTLYREHQQITTAHLGAAKQLEAEYAAACQDRSPATATAWPEVVSTHEVPGGVVLHLAPAVGSRDEVLASLQCHRAALGLDGFDRFPDDPLAIENLDLVVHAEPGGTAVMFGVDGDAQVNELRRRVDVIARAE